jgi:putative hemolysin
MWLQKGKYRARFSGGCDDLGRSQKLRARAFGLADDRDRFDAVCQHMLIEEADTNRLMCCYRMMPLEAAKIARSYSGQFYDLTSLTSYKGRLVEIGRFAIDPGARDPDILRIALAAMAKYVDENGIGFLFGCSSFAGSDPAKHLEAFSVLKERFISPKRWLPGEKAPHIYRFSAGQPRRKEGMRGMPPLLKTYLQMGGWVSDHAVIDAQMNTIHVFTGVEVGAIPPARKRILRSLAYA